MIFICLEGFIMVTQVSGGLADLFLRGLTNLVGRERDAGVKYQPQGGIGWKLLGPCEDY